MALARERAQKATTPMAPTATTAHRSARICAFAETRHFGQKPSLILYVRLLIEHAKKMASQSTNPPTMALCKACLGSSSRLFSATRPTNTQPPKAQAHGPARSLQAVLAAAPSSLRQTAHAPREKAMLKGIAMSNAQSAARRSVPFSKTAVIKGKLGWLQLIGFLWARLKTMAPTRPPATNVMAATGTQARAASSALRPSIWRQKAAVDAHCPGRAGIGMGGRLRCNPPSRSRA
mmetsp:Transcript_53076/g.106582  ORF Transcript_53076/g.106582 Transcript_53076/m.106582 type:complete len:234 (+) Transcript_53076:265-966(+)